MEMLNTQKNLTLILFATITVLSYTDASACVPEEGTIDVLIHRIWDMKDNVVLAGLISVFSVMAITITATRAFSKSNTHKEKRTARR